MRTFYRDKTVEYDKTGAVGALGLFDGVHKGHRALLSEARHLASDKKLPLLVFTFDRGAPRKGSPLYTQDERLSMLFECGADLVVIAEFDSLSDMGATEFIKDFLIDRLNLKAAVFGEDFRFGKGRDGDADMLIEQLNNYGAYALAVSEEKKGGEKISTNKIKELILGGDIEAANKLLGSPYRIETRVERGLGLGTGLGFPTVNFSFCDGRVIPPPGVYRSTVELNEKKYHGALNVGSCPTVGERSIHGECHIIGFDGDLYGKKISILVHERLRDEIRFSSVEELKMQINIDISTIITRNGEL